MRRSMADEAVWSEIEQAWRAGVPTLKAIAERHGVSRQSISREAASRGWPPRPVKAGADRSRETTQGTGTKEASGLSTASPPDDAGGPSPRVAPSNAGSADEAPSAPLTTLRDGLIRRAYVILDLRLEHMEQRLRSGEPLSPGESERMTKELGVFAGAIEKVTEVAADARSAASDRAPVIETLADVERVRRELAERLHRLWGDKEA